MNNLFGWLRRNIAAVALCLGVLLAVYGLLGFDSDYGCPVARGNLVRNGCEGTVRYFYPNDARNTAGIGAALVAVGVLTRKRKT
ncbi:hypothetical protein COU75_02715 [Candidatus Peregrinibacteria bacterium CG10_big_fil_rev_8_21_14_0_10_42_8]|nr:MAG: hypothetical protein COU75_02715 [Candidatus Peregrinibacteria bacterium CG10_big_fil_rev_8_21_14_0_10_42_8]